MTTTKPTLVLIHGAWHTPFHYSKLATALRESGYEVHVPRLLTVNGAQPPNADLNTDTALVRSYVESLVEAGRQVVVLMHSYGGQVGSNALHGLGLEQRTKEKGAGAGGVSHLIYMCAYALPEGGALVDKVKEFDMEHLLPVAFEIDEDGTILHRDPKTMISPDAQDSDPEVDAYVKALIRWNGKAMYQGASHCAWKEIPVSYIHTTQDATVPMTFQTTMVEHMRKEGREVNTVEIETGHCPNVTAIPQVVDFFKTVAI